MRYDIFKYPQLRDLREEKDLHQKEIAAYLNVKPHTYSRYETGERTISLDTMGKLADFHKTSVDYLIGRTDVKKPYPRKRKK